MLLIAGLMVNMALPLVRITVNSFVQRRYNVKFDYLDETGAFLQDHYENLPVDGPLREALLHITLSHITG